MSILTSDYISTICSSNTCFSRTESYGLEKQAIIVYLPMSSLLENKISVTLKYIEILILRAISICYHYAYTLKFLLIF